MIRHEAVGIALNVVAEEPRTNSPEVVPIVRRVPEEGLPVITAGDDMVQPMRDVNARHTCHVERLPQSGMKRQ